MSTQNTPDPATPVVAAKRVVAAQDAASLTAAPPAAPAASLGTSQTTPPPPTPAATPAEVVYFIKFVNPQEVIEFGGGETFSFPQSHFRTADPNLIAKIRKAAENPAWRINEVKETKKEEVK